MGLEPLPEMERAPEFWKNDFADPLEGHDLTFSEEYRAEFIHNGFIVNESIIPVALCDALSARLASMLAGDFDTNERPDKVPRSEAVNGNQPNRGKAPRVAQFVNAWKGDKLFSAFVHSDVLARWVAETVGWPDGAEVIQDQVWCKPPRSGPIGFHRDTAYMGEGVVTLWLALDDLEPSLGPLEYARGSHLWPPPPYEGYTPALFGKKDWTAELDKAVAHCAKNLEIQVSPDFVQVLVPRGGGSIHDGRLWHGSGVNKSMRTRRGVGIHFGPKGNMPVPPTRLAVNMAAPPPAGKPPQDSSVDEVVASKGSEDPVRRFAEMRNFK